tara:strand:- start:708 stop:926 length:219 start_codon:yes stop_codon:yes gene_type:complete
MIAARWASFVLFLLCLVPAFMGVRSWALFGLLLVFFAAIVVTTHPRPVAVIRAVLDLFPARRRRRSTHVDQT